MSYFYSMITNINENIIASSKVIYDKTNEMINSTDTHNDDEINRMYPKKNIVSDYYFFFNNPTVVHENLYLGSAFNSASISLLKKLNIKYVVNVSSEISNYFPND